MYIERRFCFALVFMGYIELVLINLLPFNAVKFSHLKVVFCSVLLCCAVLSCTVLYCVHIFQFLLLVWVCVFFTSLFNKLSKTLTLNISTDWRSINFKILIKTNFTILNKKIFWYFISMTVPRRFGSYITICSNWTYKRNQPW